MKTTSILNTNVITGTLCAGALLLLNYGASAQNVFVADYAIGNIYEYTSGGVQSTFATGLGNLNGLAFDSAGNLYVANANNDIDKITPGGMVSTFATGLNGPVGLAFNSAGNLFVANEGDNTVSEITPGGMVSTFATGLNGPDGLAFNSAGNLFVSNLGDNTITKITTGGVQSTFVGGLASPWGMAFNSAGDLFVANYDNYFPGGASITEITPGGTESTFEPGTQFSTYPTEIAFNNAGDLVAGEGRNSDVLVFAANGTLVQTINISGAQDINGLAFQPVPEPSTLALLAAGASALVLRLRRKK